jgi:tight adherence protein C
MEFVIAGLMGVAVLMVVSGMVYSRATAKVLAERLDRYGGREAAALTLEEVELREPFYDRVIKPLAQRLSKLVMRWLPNNSLAKTELKLARAGNPNGWAAADFWGVCGLGALIAGGLPFILLMTTGMPLPRLISYTSLFFSLGFKMPSIWLDRKIKARQKDIQKGLPDALDLMTVSVEAGLAFDSAMQKVSDKWTNHLSKEFERCNHEMRVGRTRREVLRDMAERVGVDDLTAFVAAVLQADQLGVSIAKVLRIQSEQMRMRRRQRAEESAQKAPIKMLFPMVFLIFPALFIVLLGPAALQLMETFGAGGL